MINFLRRIRRNLLGENKGSLYLIYAIGEVVLVVFGILIALQIDKWNENHKASEIEQQYLLALKEEFSFNMGELESIMNRNKLNFDYALRILDNTGPENPEITDEEFGSLLTNSLSTETQFDPSQGVLDEIINSGKLGIFNSKELKFALSSWSGILYRVRLQEQELLSMRSRTIEMVRNKANLRKVLGAGLENFGIKQTKFEQGNLHLLKSVAFDGHITGFVTMSWNLNNNYYPKVNEEIDRILLLIENEIIETPSSSRIETFTFSSNGVATKGKIFLPASYETNRNLPTIYLIDFTEQQFKLATDEFEKVVGGVQQIQGFDALVVTLEEHLDIDSKPEAFQEYYDVFRNMTSYVDGKYTKNTSRTFIGRGSEAGIVLMTLFLEDSGASVFESFIVTDPSPSFTSTVIEMIENEDAPKNSLDKKLHFSFSTSNDYNLCAKLINLFEEAQYSWLKYETIEYTDRNYENTYPVSFAAGIKYIFTE